MDQQETEIALFQCRECFVYIIPPGTSFGHRAELWGLNKPKETVQLKVIRTLDDELIVKLLDRQSGALYAECPVPRGQPYTTVLEPTVDSSRYFVARLVDRAQPKRHAFIGIGFRERTTANSFVMSLSEHVHYLRRQEEAAQLREQRTETAAVSPDGQPPDGQFKLQPGQKVHANLRLPSSKAQSAEASTTSGGLLSNYSGPVLADSTSGGLLAPPTSLPKPPSMRVRRSAEEDPARGEEQPGCEPGDRGVGTPADEPPVGYLSRQVSGDRSASVDQSVVMRSGGAVAVGWEIGDVEPDDWGDFVQGT